MSFEPPALRRLPVLESRRRALETCVYCPKLCRTTCPVSNAEPRETLIPWGKMSSVYFAARGDVPVDATFAAPAWACTGCHACSQACKHENPVADTLFAARAAFHRERVAPPAAARVVDGFAAHRAQTRAAVEALSRTSAGTTVLVGCLYARRLPETARDALRVARWLLGDVHLEPECCGLPLRLAGDEVGFAAQAARVTASVVADPGCALALRQHRDPVHRPVRTLVELMAERVNDLAVLGPAAVTWHDPCQLGRGLGLYDAPRAVLARVLGQPASEMVHARERASCSGGGGLLPLTMPATSDVIARARATEAGDTEIVTACASSLLRFRRAGARASDLVTWAAAAAPK